MPKAGFGASRTKKRSTPKGQVRHGKRGGAFITSKKSGKRVPAPQFSKKAQVEQEEEAVQEIPKAEKKFGDFLQEENPQSEQELQQAGAFKPKQPGQILTGVYAKLLIAKARQSMGEGKGMIMYPDVFKNSYAKATAMVKTYARAQGYITQKVYGRVEASLQKMGAKKISEVRGSTGQKYPRFELKGKVYCGHPIVMGFGGKFITTCSHADTKIHPA